MTKTKDEPTPGKWSYAKGSVSARRDDGETRPLADLISGGTYGPVTPFIVEIGQRDANGRLFAASKDLLAALEALRDLARFYVAPTDPIHVATMAAVNTAILKAKGST